MSSTVESSTKGRRNAVGALLSAFSWHVSVLLIARTLIGLAIGADSAIATAYIAEYAPKGRRGSLAMLRQWMITVGILIAYLIALVILKVWLRRRVDDRGHRSDRDHDSGERHRHLFRVLVHRPNWSPQARDRRLCRDGRHGGRRGDRPWPVLRDPAHRDRHDRPEPVHRLVRHRLGGTGWLIQGEVFPTAVRGQAASIAATIDWIANYALVETFAASQRAIGLSWVLVCFAALCVLAIAFVGRYLPETKGLSIEEITSMFEKEAADKPVRDLIHGRAHHGTPQPTA